MEYKAPELQSAADFRVVLAELLALKQRLSEFPESPSRLKFCNFDQVIRIEQLPMMFIRKEQLPMMTRIMSPEM